MRKLVDEECELVDDEPFRIALEFLDSLLFESDLGRFRIPLG